MQLIAGESLKPFYPALRHENGQLRSPSGAWIAMDGFSRGFRDFSGNGNDAIFNAGWQPTQISGPYGPAWQFDNSHYATTNAILTPSVGNTIIIVGKPGTSSGGMLGGGPLNLYYGFNGKAYWDYQGTANRISWAWPDGWGANYHVMGFRSGPSGFSSIWADGVKVAQNATYTLNATTAPLTIGQGSISAGNASIDTVLLFQGELTDSQIRLLSADPWGAFRPKPPIPALWTPPHFLSLLGVGS